MSYVLIAAKDKATELRQVSRTFAVNFDWFAELFWRRHRMRGCQSASCSSRCHLYSSPENLGQTRQQCQRRLLHRQQIDLKTYRIREGIWWTMVVYVSICFSLTHLFSIFSYIYQETFNRATPNVADRIHRPCDVPGPYHSCKESPKHLGKSSQSNPNEKYGEHDFSVLNMCWKKNQDWIK